MSGKTGLGLIFVAVSSVHFWLLWQPDSIQKIIQKSKPSYQIKLQNLSTKLVVESKAIEKSFKKVAEKVPKSVDKILKKPMTSPIKKSQKFTDKRKISSQPIVKLTQSMASIAPIKTLYLNKIHKIIHQNLHYPVVAKRLRITGVVSVLFTLLPDGEIENIRLKNISQRFLSDAAMQAIRQAKLPSFPENLPKTPLEINIPVAFRLE